MLFESTHRNEVFEVVSKRTHPTDLSFLKYRQYTS